MYKHYYTFKFVNNTCLYYLKEISEFAPPFRIGTKNTLTRLKISFRKHGAKSYLIRWSEGWNSLPELIKKQDNLNTFKQNVKKYFLN